MVKCGPNQNGILDMAYNPNLPPSLPFTKFPFPTRKDKMDCIKTSKNEQLKGGARHLLNPCVTYSTTVSQKSKFTHNGSSPKSFYSQKRDNL